MRSRSESVALLLAHGAREDQVAKDGTTLDKLMADVAPEMLKNLSLDVDAFVKRQHPIGASPDLFKTAR